MPALNKQTLINLLIDSPLREPIKINLIDIVNNTQDADLPKVFPTIQKELEIFQKATDRRLKLADETIKKLSDNNTDAPQPESTPEPASTPPTPPPTPSDSTPPPPPSAPAPTPEPPAPPTPPPATTDDSDGLQAAAPDLPPLPKPTMSADDSADDESTEDKPLPPAPELPPQESVGEDADEAALKEIQKELDALKGDAAADAGTPPTPEPAPESTKTE